MKATIDFDEGLYRRLKIEAARRGQTVRELVAEGVRYVLGQTASPAAAPERPTAWYGALRDYAPNAKGDHDLTSIRRSIGRRRGRPSP